MLTIDGISGLGGPAWLQARRNDAATRFATTPLPTAESEIWRYSRIDDLELDSFTPVLDQPVAQVGGIPVELQPVIDALNDAAGVVVISDGWVTYELLDEELAAKGVKFGRLSEFDATGENAAMTLGTLATSAADDGIAVLHDALMVDPVLVSVPSGVVVEAPFVVLHQLSIDGGVSCPHVLVRAGDNSQLKVLMHHESSDIDALVIPVVELEVGSGSNVSYLDSQLLGPRVWQIGRQASSVGRDATLNSAMVALGGDYARSRVGSTLAGQGSSATMLAVYFGEADQMHDVRTTQDHVGPRTTSNLLFKGAVQGHARSVYSGLVHIGKEGAGVNASQTNRNITLSHGAWAESVPTLEIENNDVRCAHASAVGPIDEDQRFYLESRGVPPHMAERLIVLGFFDEVLERLPVAGVVERLRAEVIAKLDRRELEAQGVNQ
ncbi:MAG: Fe-S cluster assembly protein SufD [Acidimicrobiales bacterium]